MPTTLNYTETLTVVHCTCGIAYAIPDDLNSQLLDHPGNERNTKSVYCPLGHVWHYAGKSEAQIERERAEAAERRLRATRDLLAAEERSHVATKGHLTRTKKRVSEGVCPCCHRTFQNVARHMKAKHPGYVKEPA